MAQNKKYIDLTGMIFGKWKVIKRNGSGSRGEPLWLCECSCENKTVKSVVGSGLRDGKSTNCGCVRTEKLIETNKDRRKENEYFFFNDNILGAYSNSASRDIFYFNEKYYNLISQYCWWTSNKGYIYTQIDRKTILLHLLIMNFPEGKVDHIDRNPLNNCEDNLRPANNQENGRNISISFDNITGFIGVCHSHIVNDIQQWRARINVNGKEYSKAFPTKEEAIFQRLKWEFEYYGIDFAPQRHLFEEYGII